MPGWRVTLVDPIAAVVAPTWPELRAELGVTEAFPPEALAEAEAAAAHLRMPDLDRTDPRW